MNPTKKGREVARSGKNYKRLVLRNVTASGSGITYQRAKHVNNMNTPDQALLEVRVLNFRNVTSEPAYLCSVANVTVTTTLFSTKTQFYSNNTN